MNQKEIDQHPKDAKASSSQLSPLGPRTGSRKQPTLRHLAALTAAMGFSLALMFGGATASQATTASNAAPAVQAAVAANTANDVQRGPINWTPYDGFEITTPRNCENRMYYLRGIYSWDPTAHFMCEEFTAGTGYQYWMVMVGYTQ